MAAVAVVVEVAGIAGGAAEAIEVAQPVVGGVAALPAEHPRRPPAGLGRSGRRASRGPGPSWCCCRRPGRPRRRAAPEPAPAAPPGRGRRAAGRRATGAKSGSASSRGSSAKPRAAAASSAATAASGSPASMWSAARFAGSSPTVGCAAASASTVAAAAARSPASTCRGHPLQRAHDLRHREEVVGLGRLGPGGEALGPRPAGPRSRSRGPPEPRPQPAGRARRGRRGSVPSRADTPPVSAADASPGGGP